MEGVASNASCPSPEFIEDECDEIDEGEAEREGAEGDEETFEEATGEYIDSYVSLSNCFAHALIAVQR